MTEFDYHARAELFLGSDWDTATSLGARTFRRAANALRFAFEEAAPISLRGARLQVGEREFAGRELRRLYAGDYYPLPRKAGPGGITRSITSNERIKHAGHR